MVDHIEKTRKVFIKLCADGLEEIIDNQIIETFENNHDEIKQLLMNIICFHDLGKINPAFQIEKMKNYDYKKIDDDTNHSELGWILFNLLFWKNLVDLKNDNDYYRALIITTCIAGHHTYAWGNIKDGKNLPDQPKIKRANEILKIIFGLERDDHRFFNEWNQNNLKKTKLPSVFYSLYKTIYSALILSDAIATGMAKGREDFEYKKIDTGDLDNWKRNYGKKLEKYKINRKNDIDNLDSIKEINTLRSKIFFESEKNLLNQISKNKVFCFQAPTGAGKTNCAINFMLKIFEKETTIKKCFFVFPFINIIEQNTEEIKNSLGISDSDFLEVHSISEWNTDNKEKSNLEKYYDDRIFLNGKICAISQVTLFEALANSWKSKSYPYCMLSNSVVIIDEIQAINDVLWPLLADALNKLANHNNCYIIIMSATLPRIDKLQKELKKEFLEILPDSSNYQEHSVFSNRTKIVCKFEIDDTEKLVTFICEELLSNNKILVVVNTINRAQELFKKLKNSNTGFEISLLTSQLLPHIKKRIIERSKKNSDSQNIKPYLLISTQCIEAGIDADFDIGVRDLAILDSIEQVAGRINRNNNKPTSKLFVVNLKNKKSDSELVYQKSNRWKYLEKIDMKTIIETRGFEQYYKGIIEGIKNKCNLNKYIEIEEKEWLDCVNKMDLSKLKNFRVIEDQKETCFIPIDIPIKSFSKNELELLENQKVVIDQKVIGEKIWEIYDQMSDPTKRSRKQKIELSRFNSILSKFLASRRTKQKIEKPITLIPKNALEYTYDLETGFKNLDEECIF